MSLSSLAILVISERFFPAKFNWTWLPDLKVIRGDRHTLKHKETDLPHFIRKPIPNQERFCRNIRYKACKFTVDTVTILVFVNETLAQLLGFCRIGEPTLLWKNRTTYSTVKAPFFLCWSLVWKITFMKQPSWFAESDFCFKPHFPLHVSLFSC